MANGATLASYQYVVQLRYTSASRALHWSGSGRRHPTQHALPAGRPAISSHTASFVHRHDCTHELLLGPSSVARPAREPCIKHPSICACTILFLACWWARLYMAKRAARLGTSTGTVRHDPKRHTGARRVMPNSPAVPPHWHGTKGLQSCRAVPLGTKAPHGPPRHPTTAEVGTTVCRGRVPMAVLRRRMARQPVVRRSMAAATGPMTATPPRWKGSTRSCGGEGGRKGNEGRGIRFLGSYHSRGSIWAFVGYN